MDKIVAERIYSESMAYDDFLSRSTTQIEYIDTCFIHKNKKKQPKMYDTKCMILSNMLTTITFYN